MNPDAAFWQWVGEHRHDNPTTLRFAASRWPVPWIHDAIAQVERRQRAASRLPSIAAIDCFYYPTAISVEQSTSEPLARYHASLIPAGATVADLTAGLGVDAMAIARKASSVVAVDVNPVVAEALEHNARVVGLDNLTAVCADCRDYLRSTPRQFDAIFIDPARRDDSGSRVYALSQCSPDVVAMLPQLMERCSRLVIKASPMLDITAVIDACSPHGSGSWTISRVIALGTTTECRELDIIIDRTPSIPPSHEAVQPLISAVTITPGASEVHTLDFTLTQESAAIPRYGLPTPGDTLLLPYPSVMKAAPYRLLSQRYRLTAVSPNTHLFFLPADSRTLPSDELAGVGVTLEIVETLPYSSSVIKRLAKRHPQALVAVRNMGMTADQLRAKLRVRDGGTLRIIGYSDADSTRRLIIAAPTPR